jgi:hypothetical protein
MKKLVLIIFIILTLMVSTIPVSGESAEDYKVIKQAAADKKDAGNVAWFRLEVTEKTGKKDKVKIKLPISLVETLADCTEGEINLDKNCKVNLKKILSDLKKNGPMTILEIESEEADVRIWFE